MVKLVVEESSEILVFPADTILLLKVMEVAERTVQGGRDGSFTKLGFEFKILDVIVTGDGSPKGKYEEMVGETIFGSVGIKLTDHKDNRLKQWIEAILGMEIGVGFELDTDLLEGRTVKGVTDTYIKKGTNYERHQIGSLLPASGGYAPSPTRVQTTQQPSAQTPTQQGVSAPSLIDDVPF